MTLRSKYDQAQKWLAKLSCEQHEQLGEICHNIHDAETTLLHASRDIMKTCLNGCEGICCRNIFIDAIITMKDFIYILTMAPQQATVIDRCLKHENPLFPSNCIFLHQNQGPCIFPDGLRPQVCITTFCDDERPIKKEIRQVESAFFQLGVFLFKARFQSIIRWR